MSQPKKPHTGSGQIRIIGGRWRGRKLAVPNIDGLRPTPDRVRETLFNWLQPYLWQARCLDLFAGTGALGLEALSRHAEHCIFIEQDPLLHQQLQASLVLLAAQSQAQVIRDNAVHWLKPSQQAVDLVFLDPPFRSGLLAQACIALQQQGWLKTGSVLYLEAEAELITWPVPESWLKLKEQRAGQVAYSLWQVS